MTVIRSLAELPAAAEELDDVVLTFVTQSSRTEISLAALSARAARVAGGLAELGVGVGDRIQTQMSNRPEAVVIQLAALRLGATLVPMVPVLGRSDVTQVLRDARPSVFVTEHRWNKFDYLTSLSTLPADALPQHVVVIGAPESPYLDWQALEEAAPAPDAADVDESATCLIIYTSGSTGVPKGVKHTRASIWAEALDVDYRAHPDLSDDVYLQCSAAGHIGGFMFPLRAANYRMRTIVMDGWNVALACSLVEQESVTSMVVTPFHLVQMLEEFDRSGVDLSSIDQMFAGGAPIPPGLIRRAEDAGVHVVRAYGMSEHPTVAVGRWTDPLDIRASHDGYVTVNNQVRLLDDSGVEVPPGAPGELFIRGPEQFVGYTNVSDAETFTEDGWFPTGDIATFDSGLLTIVDRKKNIIIRGGENLSASEIETVVAMHPAVAEVAVIGVPDERYGERACAFVVLADGASLELSDLLTHFVNQGVAKQKVPEFLEIVAALPRTSTGKLRKHELRRTRAAT